MSVCSDLVGIIVIEATIGDLFALWSQWPARGHSNRIWPPASRRVAANSVVMADFRRLGHELDSELSRLQGRLAA